jgi:hypothetical protein
LPEKMQRLVLSYCNLTLSILSRVSLNKAAENAIDKKVLHSKKGKQ